MNNPSMQYFDKKQSLKPFKRSHGADIISFYCVFRAHHSVKVKHSIEYDKCLLLQGTDNFEHNFTDHSYVRSLELTHNFASIEVQDPTP